MKTQLMGGALIAAVLSASPAFAQTPATTSPAAEKGFVNVSVGGQLSTLILNGTVSAPVYNQTANASTSREVSGGPLFDAMAGVHVHGRVSIAAMLSLRTATSDAALNASVPHPLFSDSPRNVSTTIAGLKHQETWFGLLAAYQLPSTGRGSITVFGGPAVASVKHDAVTGLTVAEGASLSTPTVTASTGTISKSFWGFAIGVDARMMLAKSVGIGGFVRYTAAPGNVTGTESVTLGGLQAAAGIRFRF